MQQTTPTLFKAAEAIANPFLQQQLYYPTASNLSVLTSNFIRQFHSISAISTCIVWPIGPNPFNCHLHTVVAHLPDAQ